MESFLRGIDFAYFKSNRNNFVRLFRKYAKNLLLDLPDFNARELVWEGPSAV